MFATFNLCTPEAGLVIDRITGKNLLCLEHLAHAPGAPVSTLCVCHDGGGAADCGSTHS